MIFYHIISFCAGFFLDFILGDPHFPFHPVCLTGKLISFFDRVFLGNPEEAAKKGRRQKFFLGLLTVLFVCLISEAILLAILFAAFYINPWLFCLFESLMVYFLLAARSLEKESMKVYYALEENNLSSARSFLSMIVGRDTQNLSQEGICRATVETVAENTSDGVIAPMIFLAIGGSPLGLLYKAVNTMDSMIAYKNERYIDFGCCAARSDDFLNLIPSRISAVLMIISTGLCRFFYPGKFYFSNSIRIFLRDRYKHQSPNSAQTESVCAGALGLKLAGPASYEGKIEEKPYIGDQLRLPEADDIKRADMLMYFSAFLCFFISCGIMILMMVF